MFDDLLTQIEKAAEQERALRACRRRLQLDIVALARTAFGTYADASNALHLGQAYFSQLKSGPCLLRPKQMAKLVAKMKEAAPRPRNG